MLKKLKLYVVLVVILCSLFVSSCYLFFPYGDPICYSYEQTELKTSGIYCDGIEWKYNEGSLIVSGFGEMKNFLNLEWESFPWAWLRDDINTIIVSDGITSIADGAFNFLENVTSISLGSDIVEIGDLAFANTSIREISLPPSVSDIGANPFYGCLNLENIVIEEENNFLNFSNGVLYSDECRTIVSLWKVPSEGFVSTVETIGDYAYSGSTIKEISIPEGVREIGNYAFQYAALKQVSLPDSLVSIGDYAFLECHFDEISFGASLKYIGKGSFEDCELLEYVEIGDNVVSIGDNAFYGCDSLLRVRVGDVKHIGKAAFGVTVFTRPEPDQITPIDDFILICGENSIAQQYAEQNGLRWEIG